MSFVARLGVNVECNVFCMLLHPSESLDEKAVFVSSFVSGTYYYKSTEIFFHEKGKELYFSPSHWL